MPKTETTPRVLDIDAAHEYLNRMGVTCNVRQVRRWAEKRDLPFYKPNFGRRLLIREEDLVAVVTAKDTGIGHTLATS